MKFDGKLPLTTTEMDSKKTTASQIISEKITEEDCPEIKTLCEYTGLPFQAETENDGSISAKISLFRGLKDIFIPAFANYQISDFEVSKTGDTFEDLEIGKVYIANYFPKFFNYSLIDLNGKPQSGKITATELKFPASAKKSDWQPLFPKIVKILAEKKLILDNGGYNSAQVIQERIQKTEEINDSRLFIFKVFNIQKRATESGIKETGDLIDDLKTTLTTRQYERDIFFEENYLSYESEFQSLNDYFTETKFDIDDSISYQDQIAELQERTETCYFKLTFLLFIPGLTDQQRAKSKELLAIFINFLNTAFKSLLMSIKDFHKRKYIAPFVETIFSYLACLYLSGTFASRLSIKLHLLQDYNFCFNLIIFFLQDSSFKGKINRDFLQINDLEKILLSLFEMGKDNPSIKGKDHVLLNYFFIYIYTHNYALSAALMHFDQGIEAIFNKFYEGLSDSSTPALPLGFSFFEFLLKSNFELALADKIEPPQKLKERSEKILEFLIKFRQKLNSTVGHQHKISQDFYLNAISYTELLNYINQKLIPAFKNFQAECQKLIEEKNKPKKTKPSKEPKPKTEPTKNKNVDYKLADIKLPPKKQTSVSALIPPALTQHISFEAETKDIQARQKKYAKKKRQQRKKHAASQESLDDKKIETPEKKTDNLENKIFNLVHPFIKGLTYKAKLQLGTDISPTILNRLVEVLLKGKISSGKMNQVVLCDSTEPINGGNKFFPMKAKIKEVRCYAHWVTDSKIGQFLLFKTIDYSPHKGGKSKLKDKKHQVDKNTTNSQYKTINFP